MARTKANDVSTAAKEFIESIDKVRVFKVKKGVVVATATLIFDNGLAVAGFTIFEKDGSQWLSFPSVKRGDDYAPTAWLDKDYFTDADKQFIKTGLLNKILDEIPED